MSETVTAPPLQRWQGERGTYYVVIFTSHDAQTLAAHAALQRLELGRRRGFGSLKVTARIGESEWRTSVFPQTRHSEWMLLVARAILRAERLSPGETVAVTLML